MKLVHVGSWESKDKSSQDRTIALLWWQQHLMMLKFVRCIYPFALLFLIEIIPIDSTLMSTWHGLVWISLYWSTMHCPVRWFSWSHILLVDFSVDSDNIESKMSGVWAGKLWEAVVSRVGSTTASYKWRWLEGWEWNIMRNDYCSLRAG